MFGAIAGGIASALAGGAMSKLFGGGSQNTKDQVYAQNEMLAYQQKESTARVASIMENTNLSKQQQVSEIMRQMLTQAQTAGQYFTNDQIKEMTRKVSAEVDLVHQQTQNQRYGSSH